jgi:hypothetical protein
MAATISLLDFELNETFYLPIGFLRSGNAVRLYLYPQS